jgi:hypothetical protein
VNAATNGTGEYLLSEPEEGPHGYEYPDTSGDPFDDGPRAVGRSQRPFDRFDSAVDETVHSIQVAPENTITDIARLCVWFSTPQREVFARIECVRGKPVAYFVRGTHKDFLPAFLRRQGG